MSADTFRVEVAYARPDQQWLVPLDVPAGTTAIEAIRRSGLLALCPEIDLDTQKIGIFERACPPDTLLRANDRVVIYRSLIADPKEVRRQRANLTRRKPRGRA